MKAVLLFFCVVFLAAALPVRAVPLEELVDAGTAARLEAGESITEVQLSRPSPRLMVNHAYIRNLAAQLAASVGPSMLVENLRLYPKPEGAGGTDGAWTGAERTGLYNQLLALSSLAGLQYWSSSRGAWRTFYETSRVIDDPRTRRPLPDPVFDTPPEQYSLYARQKDLTFGDNVYRYEYHAQEDALVLVQENMTAMNIAIVTAIGRNRLRSVVAVVDAGPWLLLYTFSTAKAAALPGLGTRIGNSFVTRLEAISGWFTDRAASVFGPPAE